MPWGSRLRSADYRPQVEALEDRLAPGEALPVLAPELLTMAPVFAASEAGLLPAGMGWPSDATPGDLASQGLDSPTGMETPTTTVADFSQALSNVTAVWESGVASVSPLGAEIARTPALAGASLPASASAPGAHRHHGQGHGGIQPDFNSGDLYVTSYGNNSLLDYNLTTGMGTVVLAGGGLNAPCDMVFAPDGGLYIANQGNNTIGRLDPDTGAYTTFASGISGATGLALSPDGGSLFVTSLFGNSILQYDLATGQGTTFATNVGLSPAQLAVSPDGTQLYVATGDSVFQYDLASGQGTTLAMGLNRPTGLAFGPNGGLYVALQIGNAILEFNTAAGQFRKFATDGNLSAPEDLAVSPDGATLYSANYFNSTILQFDLSSRVPSTFATGSPINGAFGLAFAP
jgi:streptogramin lyase